VSQSIPARIADLQTFREVSGKVSDFVSICRFMMLGGSAGGAERLAEEARAPARVLEAIGDLIVPRAVTDPLSIGSVGTVLSPFQALAQAFMSSLSNSAFDTMLPAMLRVPLRTRIFSSTSLITGASLNELDVKRVGSLSIAASDLEISKSGAVIAITREVVVGGVDGSQRYLENELRVAVAVATDTRFLSLITAGATSFPSNGANANGLRQDLRSALQGLTLGASSRPFLITTPDIAAGLAAAGDNSGGPAFPGARWNGGEAAGIPIIVSDACPAQTMIFADASGIAAGSEELRVDSSGIANLQMDTAPDSPPIAGTSYVNLWTQNMLAMKVERFFGAKVVRANAVVTVTGVNATGGSPA